MPKTKNCPLCGQANKLSAVACTHCASPLDKKPSQEPTKQRYRCSGSTRILIPAGPPPCKPSVIDDPADQDILDWAYAIIEKGRESGMEFAPSALKYFAKTFWTGATHARVAEIIDRVIGESGLQI